MSNTDDLISLDACKGYTAAATIGAGLSPEQTGAVLENLEAAFENMTADEAEQYYLSDEWTGK